MTAILTTLIIACLIAGVALAFVTESMVELAGYGIIFGLLFALAVCSVRIILQ